MSLLQSTIQGTAYATSSVKQADIGGRIVERKVAMPVGQVNGKAWLPCFRTINPVSYNQAMLQNPTLQNVQLQHSDLTYVRHLTMKMNITCNGGTGTVLAPTFQLFQQVVCSAAENMAPLQTTYSETMTNNLLIQTPVGQQKTLFKAWNIGDETGFNYLGQSLSLQSGETRTVYLPLFQNGGFLSGFDGISLQDLKSDLVLSFTPANGGGVVSGTGTFTISSLTFIVESARLRATDAKIFRDRFSNNLVTTNYLDTVIIPKTNVTLNAGVNQFAINTLSGYFSHILMVVRNIGSWNNLTGNSQFCALNVGNASGGSFDFVDNSGTSILGLGSPIPLNYLTSHIASDSCANDFLATKSYYNIPFCQNIRQALQDGVINGGFWFGQNDPYNLNLTPIQSVNEVQTISCTGTAPAAGEYAFIYKGERSASIAYNASAATMASTVAAMKVFQSTFVTCAFSGALSSGTSVTATFTTPQGALDGATLQISGDGLGAGVYSTVVTTKGVDGINLGSNYDVYLYCMKWRNCSFTNGSLVVHDATAPVSVMMDPKSQFQ